jgi:alkyl hydroperoxide reductase subunit AhpF
MQVIYSVKGMALSKNLKKMVSDSLSGLKSPVKILFFTSGKYPKVEKEIESVINDMVSLNKKLSLEKYSIGSKKAKSEGITRGPVLSLKGKQKGNVRFFGFPSGYQFPVFLADLLESSGAKKVKAKKVSKKTEIRVFEMPACAYSPVAVKVAHNIAMANKKVTADMVDALLFPELITKYKIRKIPATVINGKLAFTGVRTSDQLVKQIR